MNVLTSTGKDWLWSATLEDHEKSSERSRGIRLAGKAWTR